MSFFSEYWWVGSGVAIAFLIWQRHSRTPITLDLERRPSQLPRREPAPRLADALPEFAAELESLLTAENKPELAAQVQGLALLDRCRCQDDFCSTFYVRPQPEGRYGPDHYTVILSPEDGMVNVDVVGGEITCVEVLYRDDVQAKLQTLL